MEKVFITGRGLVTPLGNGLAVNEAALRSGASGIVQVPEFIEQGLDSIVGGMSDENPPLGDLVDRKKMRYCPPVAAMSVYAVNEALNEAGISREALAGYRVALIGGTATGYNREVYGEASKYIGSDKRLRVVNLYSVPRVMPSSAISNLSLIFGIKGETYDISAACASGAISIIVGTRLIRSGMYDMVIAGGAESLDWVTALGFNAIRALSRKYNDDPARASRPFDRGRDGFVLAGGAGYVVLESERSVKARGARPISEVMGVASNSNGIDMVVPDAASCAEVMLESVKDAGLKPEDIGYINTHGTATPVGDPVEMSAIKSVFGGIPAINSTKSQTGHMVGATGAAEIIFSSMMLEKHYLSRSVNLEDPEPDFSWADLLTEYREGTSVRYALSNSFAFGGSNASVVIGDCGTGM
ncbi:MAG: beta-ketoacyl-[Lentisphaeria bacterium]|nr:beta-ketoacyl-[acyl-carrier-protein] synthase family protein [Lentisphaeria bacterium]MBR2643052.1 beta-ketoacyl-[acyl-carrier-protein] synthase family protein [Lentisphaeria bacterium]